MVAQARQQPQKLILGMAGDSCGAHPSAKDNGGGAGEGGGDRETGGAEAALEKREWEGDRQGGALKPGHHIGPYRLQVSA